MTLAQDVLAATGVAFAIGILVALRWRHRLGAAGLVLAPLAFACMAFVLSFLAVLILIFLTGGT